MSWFRRRNVSGTGGERNAHPSGHSREPDDRRVGTVDERGQRFPSKPPRGVDAGFCYNDDREE